MLWINILCRMKEEKRMKETNLEIKKLGINGEGIGYINRKITFVKGALPQEEVSVEVTNDTRSFKEAKLIKVLKKSEHRVQAPCFQQNHCLGCPIMHMSYDQQLYFKKDIIRDSLRHYTKLDLRRVDFRRCLPSLKQEGYRDCVHLPIVRFNQKVTFGIYQRETKYLTIMNRCGVQNPLINRCLNDLEAIFEENRVRSYSEETRTGLRFLTVRVFEEKAQLVFVTGRDRLDNKLIEAIEKLDYVHSIYYTINTNKGQEFSHGHYEKVSGATRQEFMLEGKKFIISPKSEYPINTSMVPTVIQTVKSLLSKEVKSLLEINCSMGWLGMNLDDAIEVKGIDFDRVNIEDAKLNAKFLKKENCSYESGKLEELTKQLTKNKKFDAFIVHSNKLGMRKTIKESLVKGKIKELIYLSSSPSSFAKDVSDLENNYQVESIVPIDMLPHSQNVLVVAKLRLKK